MIIILDTSTGAAENFTTRNDAAEFIGVSRPTLRTWLTKPFFLYKTLIITHTSNEKVNKSKRALLKKQMEKFHSEEIERPVNKVGFLSIDNTRLEQSAKVANVVNP